MSDIVKDNSNKETTKTSSINANNIIVTALFFSVLGVLLGMYFRTTSNDGGGGGHDPSDTLARKVAKLEERIDAFSKVLNDEDRRRLKDTGPSFQKDRLPVDCEEIYDRGIRQDGVYQISPDGRCPFQVYCDMANGAWTVIQRHEGGKVYLFIYLFIY